MLAYLMMDKGMTMRAALDHVRERRTIAAPNPGFMIQLKAFEKFIHGTNSECPLVIPKDEGMSEAQKEIIAAVEKMSICEAEERKGEEKPNSE